MLLTIDVGNTQTVIGLYQDDDASGNGAGAGLLDHWRIATDADRTADEHAVIIRNLLEASGFTFDVDHVAMCAGVPRVLASLRQMIERHGNQEPVVIEPGVRTGMPILYDNPREVGADRIANAVAAFDLYGGPLVVVDFGTGNNFDVISAKGEFMGGAIAPGIEISLDALFGKAAALGAIELVEPRNVIGKSTKESLQSGAIYGFAAQIDGMVERFRAELDTCTVVATGGLAHLIAPVAHTIEHVEPFLTLHGLRLVYQRNQELS
ncbi:MAG: type III pantothenate kinase [Actinobacteria bacterium]|jgi:type III pantothenate kinase|nr:type III pantothenate kinase [Actinomycetota bacterium]MBT3747073.1 type III pantothenate kinase [Actinomycetota bacterium]MBT3968981.1 type III pantothenate kinase [Actinomycetota bacterium]MBT4009622.1 type III pantothenate kinase [Actinomycetota bacterium]MBT4303298.1 type III pantothenate kinase [Actinomycetota bacterium]